MRHKKRGRTLGRSSSHRKAMLKNLASSLFLTERDSEFDDNAPKVKGRVVTTLQKAKEVRPLVEKCITIARRSLVAAHAAEQHAPSAERGTEAWKQWRNSEAWQQWCEARAPVVAARRRALRLLGDKQAVSILFEEVAPRFEHRDGGYTRVLKLATPRLGDAGDRAILELVGKHDRVKVASSKPAFEDEAAAPEEEIEEAVAEAESSEEAAAADTEGDADSGEAKGGEAEGGDATEDEEKQ